MNRTLMLLVVVAYPVVALAQAGPPANSQSSGSSYPYQPVVPAPTINTYSGGGWSGHSGGGTAAGNAMSGMSQVISAKGQYNLATSAAARILASSTAQPPEWL